MALNLQPPGWKFDCLPYPAVEPPLRECKTPLPDERFLRRGNTGNSIFLHGSLRDHGLAHEGEDIRTMVPGLSEAMAEVVAGTVNTGPALTSHLWLAANRERLRPERGELGVEAERPSH